MYKYCTMLSLEHTCEVKVIVLRGELSPASFCKLQMLSNRKWPTSRCSTGLILRAFFQLAQPTEILCRTTHCRAQITPVEIILLIFSFSSFPRITSSCVVLCLQHPALQSTPQPPPVSVLPHNRPRFSCSFSRRYSPLRPLLWRPADERCCKYRKFLPLYLRLLPWLSF